MGSGFSRKKKEAKKMQEQMLKMQAELASQEVAGSAGNGLVKVTLNGEGQLKTISISPECVDPDDVEGLEDLIQAAFDNAVANQPEMEGLPFSL